MIEPRFPDFAGLWTPLCLAGEVAADRPASFIVAGERIVVFRDRAGSPRALVDRCPHRGVALSLGNLVGGEIACPFHGWRFDGAGRCRHVPWNPEAKLDTLSATPLPLREQHGVLWLFTGTDPTGEPSVPDVLGRAGVRVTAQHMLWNVHWTRVMENMLDSPHLPFVHASTIGKQLKGRSDRQMEMSWHPAEGGAVITARREGEEPRTSLRYHFPNMMELTIDPPGKLLRMLAVCVPEQSGRTRLSVYTLRDFARWRLLDPLFRRANTKIAAEDQAIVESSLPTEVPPAAQENSVASDAPTLAFRKIWFSRIKDR